MEFQHIPVLLEEVLEGLDIKKDGIYVDGTIGGAGHSKEIVKRLDKGRLIGIDQDTRALEAAEKNLKDYMDKVSLVHSNYYNMDKVLADLNIDKVDGILLDIGVSSYQLDKSDRGFSYHNEARLDMRMDTSQKLTAWDVINKYEMSRLEDIIFNYGEERWAKRIAEFIVEERKSKTIDTTLDLVEVIKKAIPKKAREEAHPGKKTFQAIRIEVNRELDVLENGIPMMTKLLNKKGRLAIITFHSLEDRIVKHKFRYLSKSCICPPELPICACDKKKELKVITRKPIIPSDLEIRENSRSRSSKLRIAEKI